MNLFRHPLKGVIQYLFYAASDGDGGSLYWDDSSTYLLWDDSSTDLTWDI